MEKYYEVNLRIIVDPEKNKAVNQTYLVSAVSITDAEVKVTKDMENVIDDWEIKGIKESKIFRVV